METASRYNQHSLNCRTDTTIALNLVTVKRGHTWSTKAWKSDQTRRTAARVPLQSNHDNDTAFEMSTRISKAVKKVTCGHPFSRHASMAEACRV